MQKRFWLMTLSSLLFFTAIFIFVGCVDDIIEPSDDARQKFLGTWLVSESCVRLDYQAVIIADANDESKVLIDNFAAPGSGFPPAYGFVAGNVITMPRQTIGDNWRVEGTGTYKSAGTIFWEYKMEIGANSSNCTADYK